MVLMLMPPSHRLRVGQLPHSYATNTWTCSHYEWLMVWAHRFTEVPGDVVTGEGGRCSVFFDNQLYDNVKCGRKGVTSRSWPKPKLKINFHSNNVRTYLTPFLKHSDF